MVLLVISALFNVLLLWYIRKMLKKLLFVSDNIGALQEEANNFSEHLKGIYELEMFYGDETLSSLMAHSKEIIENIKEFEEIYSLTYEDLDNRGYSGDEEEEE